MLSRILTLAVLVYVTSGHPHVQKVRYDGHQVFEVLHNTEEDFKKLLELEMQFELDFWKLPKHINDTIHVNVAPHFIDEFMKELKKYNMRVSTFIDNVQKCSVISHHLLQCKETSQLHRRRIIDDGPSRITQHHHKRASTRSSGVQLNVYHTHASIRSYLAHLASMSLPHGNAVTVSSIGDSVEGRKIEVIKITSSSHSGPKQSILIDGGIHAREWISPATVIYIIEHLIFNPDNDQNIVDVLQAYDIHVIPVLNPDGYEYTDYVRLWRKNRNPITQSCYGVDLNRNFPFEWNPNVGGSNSPCSDLYSGKNAESEQETQALTTYLRQHQFIGYLTVHSYGQMWLYPWGYTSALPSDWAQLDQAANAGMAALRSVYNTRYVTGSSTNVLYSAAGGSDDFAKGGANVKYSYTLELRDEGRYGFQLPTNQILPTGQETLKGFLAFAKEVKTIEGF